MEKRIKHIATILIIGVFGFLALACEDDEVNTGPIFTFPPSCSDPVVIKKDPIAEPVSTFIYYNVVLLDKETNKPIPGLYVYVYYWKSFCDNYDNCPGTCIMSAFRHTLIDYISNGSGSISGQTVQEMTFNDKKDRVKVRFTIKDPSGVYSTRRVTIKYNYLNNTQSHTFYLLKNNAL